MLAVCRRSRGAWCGQVSPCFVKFRSKKSVQGSLLLIEEASLCPHHTSEEAGQVCKFIKPKKSSIIFSPFGFPFCLWWDWNSCNHENNEFNTGYMLCQLLISPWAIYIVFVNLNSVWACIFRCVACLLSSQRSLDFALKSTNIWRESISTFIYLSVSYVFWLEGCSYERSVNDKKNNEKYAFKHRHDSSLHTPWCGLDMSLSWGGPLSSTSAEKIVAPVDFPCRWNHKSSENQAPAQSWGWKENIYLA